MTTTPPEETPQAESTDGPTHAGMAVYAIDTGRILMIQRSLDPEDPPEVQGTWEFPGGTIEEGEDSITAAWREFSEETGLKPPEDGEVRGSWLSKDGIYEGFVYKVPVEADAFSEINPDLAAAEAINPDDPQRRQPDVSAWFTVEQIKGLGAALRPEVALTDWSVFEGDKMTETPAEKMAALMLSQGMSYADVARIRFANTPTEKPPLDEPVQPEEDPVQPDPSAPSPALGPAHDKPVPFHLVIAEEGTKTGDGRRFLPNSLSNRPLPLPLGWQKFSQPEHNQSVVVGRIDKIKKTPIVNDQGDTVTAQVGSGHFISNVEAAEFMALLAEFGRFGLSVDADDAAGEVNEADMCVDFSQARTSGATAVPIPALYQSWVGIGEAPVEWGLDEPDQVAPVEEPPMVELVAGAGIAFKDLAPGKTEDGPGWLTNPVDTDRLRDYWVSGPGAAKIGWGVPGDFNRCRVEVGKYVEPQHLAGYCANRHYDALGFWPGRPLSGETVPFAAETLGLEDTTPAPSMVMTASAGDALVAPAQWFAQTEWTTDDPRMVEFEPGKFACPFTVTAEGQVFGHIAARGTCHISPQFDYCVEPPMSETDYSYFRTGAVLLDDGEMAATGVISIGGGHAGERLSARQALAHYDSTSTAAADVILWDDEFGIACAGWVRPGTTPEMVAALRASKVSGDWRPWGPHPLEMVAALAVNVPGFGVPRVRIAASGQKQLSLVAAGLTVPVADKVAEDIKTLDVDTLAYKVAGQVAAILGRKQQIEALASRAEKV